MSVEAGLTLRFHETLRESRLVRGVRVETWASKDTGTWTLLARAGGIACVLESGKGWQGRLIDTHFPAFWAA